MRLPKFAAVTVSLSTALVMQLPVLAQAAANAGSTTDALEFHELLRSSVPGAVRSDKALSQIHMIPDSLLQTALEASSAEEAIKIAGQSSLEKLAKETSSLKSGTALNADAILAKQPLTIVIVPGIFGEFIPTRAFEDVLSKPSTDRDAFIAKVKAAAAKSDPNAKDSSYNMDLNAQKIMSLEELVNVGSLTDANGRTLARVVLLYTPFMSLESMGNLEKHAEIFNRRLSKYLALTGPQRLALVGYSRGTVLGLEMLAQAKQKNLPWLSDVKSMISLGGVNWGSTLADDVNNPTSAQHDAVVAVQALRNDMSATSITQNAAAWGRFGISMTRLVPRLAVHANAPKSSDLKNSPLGFGLDTMSILRLVKTVWVHLGLNHPISNFGDNVVRFQRFVDEALSGVNSLTSQGRTEWWKTHVLPQNVNYLAVTAAMANPESGAFDLAAFDGPYGYSKRSYDDLMLLQNRLDYESMSGLSLNDSQVSVPQAAFLPNAIAKLNPANAGLRTEFLGTVGTHHWGLALRVVNQMKDGRLNPFPREALLKALAAKVALDMDRDSANQK